MRVIAGETSSVLFDYYQVPHLKSDDIWARPACPDRRATRPSGPYGRSLILTAGRFFGARGSEIRQGLCWWRW
jgi:hypothetical protein